MDKPKVVRAGMGIMVMDLDGRVLMGLRNDDADKASSELAGEGTWTMPGGKFEFGDDLFAGAARELKEETDLDAAHMEIKSITNDKYGDAAHFVTLGFLCTEYTGEVKTMEPDEITEWRWFSLDALPAKIFGPSRKVIDNYLAKRLTGDA